MDSMRRMNTYVKLNFQRCLSQGKTLVICICLAVFFYLYFGDVRGGLMESGQKIGIMEMFLVVTNNMYTSFTIWIRHRITKEDVKQVLETVGLGNTGRKKISLIGVSALISVLIIGCKEKSSVAEKTVPDYTLIYKMEQNRDISITADKGYYEALARDKSCRWKEAIAYPNLKEETKFDSDDYLNWAMAAVDSAMTNDGYVTFFQDLNICKGEKFYGLGEHRMQGSGQKVTAGHRGRIYIMMTVAGGAFDFRVEDESGNILWEKDQVADSEQVFLNIDEMPESVIGVLTDHTQEKDKEKLFYTVMILAATEREATE